MRACCNGREIMPNFLVSHSRTDKPPGRFPNKLKPDFVKAPFQPSLSRLSFRIIKDDAVALSGFDLKQSSGLQSPQILGEVGGCEWSLFQRNIGSLKANQSRSFSTR